MISLRFLPVRRGAEDRNRRAQKEEPRGRYSADLVILQNREVPDLYEHMSSVLQNETALHDLTFHSIEQKQLSKQLQLLLNLEVVMSIQKALYILRDTGRHLPKVSTHL